MEAERPYKSKPMSRAILAGISILAIGGVLVAARGGGGLSLAVGLAVVIGCGGMLVRVARREGEKRTLHAVRGRLARSSRESRAVDAAGAPVQPEGLGGIDALARERERARDACVEAERERFACDERLDAVLEASRDHAILFVDLDGRITGANAATERVFGHDPGELSGCHVRSLLSDPIEDLAVMRDLQGRLLDGERRGSCEVDGRHRDGRTFPVSLSMALRRYESGEPAGLVVVSCDVTSFREERELILRNRELERASRLKSEFLANMSHELRTPLNSVIGFSEVLLDGFFGELNEQQQEYIRDIHHSGRHLLDLINDILDLSKIEAGRMELQLESFDLREAIDRVIHMVEAQAIKKKIDLDSRIADSAGTLRADSGRFKQILLNLLSNAVKFTPERGKVAIEVETIDGEVRLRVMDTGIGIPPQSLPTIFDKFQQVEGGYRRQYGGTGLGLAIVKEFMQLHGGRVEVASELGEGSVFSLAFPVRRAGETSPGPSGTDTRDEGGDAHGTRRSIAPRRARERSAEGAGSGRAVHDGAEGRPARNPSPVASAGAEDRGLAATGPEDRGLADAGPEGQAPGTNEEASGAMTRRSIARPASGADPYEPAIPQDAAEGGSDRRGPRILVVDDDPFQLKRIFQYLSPPYRVETAMTGAQAVERVRQSPPSLVLLKIFLPDMDGWEVLRCIKEIPEARTIPVVITSLGSDGDRGLVLGAADYLVKPVPRRELLKSLDTLPLRVPGRTSPPRILLVDDSAKDIRLIESYLRPAGYRLDVLRDPSAGFERVRETRPDVVLLDLMLPGGAAFDLAATIREYDDRKSPIVIFTNGRQSVDEKITLMEQVYGLSSNRGFDRSVLQREVAGVLRMRGEDASAAGVPWRTAGDEAPGGG